ncbi:MAG: hypothetical protein IT158_31660 [Bryobacterales bacterium]|nr:hypothetical protein [Bryobacterales bacterium]
MMRLRNPKTRGQALVMVALSLIAMCGIIGLAVDLGWSFFVRKAARGAADSAAMAAVIEGFRRVGTTGTYACGTNLTCQTVTPCPTSLTTPANNIENGCLYAQQNGFRVNGSNNRQNVTMEADVPPTSCRTASPPNCIPTAPGVFAYYWATARVTESIPQLFSAVLGNGMAVVSARATAALTDSIVIGSLILLNRENDVLPSPIGRGRNYRNDGGPTVNAPGGIIMSSQCYGTNCPEGNNKYAMAGELTGSGSISAGFTYIRGTGTACAGNLPGCSGYGQSTWVFPPTNNQPVGDPMFEDPMRGIGQPPVNAGQASLPDVQVLNGVLAGSNDPQNPTELLPGNYYAITRDPKTGVVSASGEKIELNGYFRFATCSGCRGTGFGTWVFFGGMRTAGGTTTVQFSPGQYIFAGQNDNPDDSLVFLDNGTTFFDYTPAGQTQNDAGQILIFTNASYPGLAVPGTVDPIKSTLRFGQSGFTMGNNAASRINLHGLDRDAANLPANLIPFAPTALWQDQRNSVVQYDANGNINTSCGGDLDHPCSNAPTGSEIMHLQATPDSVVHGLIYQPRGAYLDLQGGGVINAPLKIITGSLNMGGTPQVTLTSTENPVVRRVVALVE